MRVTQLVENIAHFMYPRGLSWEGVDWIHLDQDRDQWRTPVSTVVNLRVPHESWNFLTS